MRRRDRAFLMSGRRLGPGETGWQGKIVMRNARWLWLARERALPWRRFRASPVYTQGRRRGGSVSALQERGTVHRRCGGRGCPDLLSWIGGYAIASHIIRWRHGKSPIHPPPCPYGIFPA